MAKKQLKKQERLRYKSSLAGLGNAVEQANKLDADGYDVQFCFAVVATDESKDPPQNVQAIWMLARRRDA